MEIRTANGLERLRSLLDHASDLIQIAALDGQMIWANAAWCQALGYEPTEVCSLNFFHLLQIESRDRYQPFLQSLVANNSEGDIELTLKTQRNAAIALKGRVSCQMREDGSLELWSIWQPISCQVERNSGNVCDQPLAEISSREPLPCLCGDLYQAVVASLQEAIISLNQAGQICTCNQSAERILGLSAKQIHGLNFFELPWHTIHEDGSQILVEQHPIAVTLRTGQSVSNAVMGIYKPSGVLTWVSVNAQPLFNPGGNQLCGTVASFTDITTRKQLEATLQRNETCYRAIVEDLTELVCRFLPDGTLTFANSAYCQVLGIPLEELIGHSYKMFLLALDKETEISLTTITTPARPVNWLEHQVILPNGAVRWQQWCSRAIFDDQGECIEFQAVGRDVTDRRQAEAELREMSTALSNAVEGISRLDAEGRYVKVNRAYASITGYSPEEMIGMDWHRTVHPDDLEKLIAAYQQMISVGKTETEARGIRKDGTLFHKQVVMVAAYDQQRCFTGHHCFLKDISDRKRAEQKMLQALAKEKELNELRSCLVSMISHEFRTPLTTIQSATELLEYYEWSQAEKQERFHQIHEAVMHMTQLLEDVLLIGKAEVGKLEYSPKPLDLSLFCRKLVTDTQMIVGDRYQITFRDQGVVEPVEIDQKLLRHILTNLLSNAVKYSPTGSKIEVKLNYQRHCLNLQVRDKGIGIPAEARQHLFEAFYRANNVSTIQGTGLGLAIVKKCVEMHQGTIELESQVGEGTTFTVTIPRSAR